MADITNVTQTVRDDRTTPSPAVETAEKCGPLASAQVLKRNKPARRQRPCAVEPTPDPDIGSVEPTASKPSELTNTTVPRISKCDCVLSLLRREGGATVSEIMAVSHWQAHSVRGFLSGTVRKKMGVDLLSEVTGEGTRRYRIASGDRNDSSDDMLQSEPTDLPAFLPFKRDRHLTATASNTVAPDVVEL